MNIKITKEQHEKLCSFRIASYTFGSNLHGTNNEYSDLDLLQVIDDSSLGVFLTLGRYLPNQNTFQYDDLENNTQYIWMTKTQFYQGLFSGDLNIVADIVLLGDYTLKEDYALFLCRTYKIIKSYLGLVKRDLKYFDKNIKKQRHCIRSLYMAECLIDNKLPEVSKIKDLEFLTRQHISEKLDLLRVMMNLMYETNELTLYPAGRRT